MTGNAGFEHCNRLSASLWMQCVHFPRTPNVMEVTALVKRNGPSYFD